MPFQHDGYQRKLYVLSLEYVNKGKDPHEANGYDQTSGEAFLSNLTYTKNNFGATVEFACIGEHGLPCRKRRLQSTGLMNYLPALTRQHDYLTTNIYVYNAQAMGEIGGQLDMFLMHRKVLALVENSAPSFH
jgi:hypothetical protein